MVHRAIKGRKVRKARRASEHRVRKGFRAPKAPLAAVGMGMELARKDHRDRRAPPVRRALLAPRVHKDRLALVRRVHKACRDRLAPGHKGRKAFKGHRDHKAHKVCKARTLGRSRRH